jgi:hypothetical protein
MMVAPGDIRQPRVCERQSPLRIPLARDDTFLAPLLNRRKPVLEGVHVAGRSAFTFQSRHSFCPRRQDSFCHRGFVLAK